MKPDLMETVLMEMNQIKTQAGVGCTSCDCISGQMQSRLFENFRSILIFWRGLGMPSPYEKQMKCSFTRRSENQFNFKHILALWLPFHIVLHLVFHDSRSDPMKTVPSRGAA
jgi:hypothetical protein